MQDDTIKEVEGEEVVTTDEVATAKVEGVEGEEVVADEATNEATEEVTEEVAA